MLITSERLEGARVSDVGVETQVVHGCRQLVP